MYDFDLPSGIWIHFVFNVKMKGKKYADMVKVLCILFAVVDMFKKPNR